MKDIHHIDFMHNRPDILVSLLVEERSGRHRSEEPVTLGVAFPQGAVYDPATLTLSDAQGQQCPIQAQTLAYWFDGSAKWVLFDFTADVQANMNTVYEIRSAGAQSAVTPSLRVMVRESAEQIVVDTGKALFCLNRQFCKPFDQIVIGQADLLVAQGTSFELTDEKGELYLPRINDLCIESKGPLRVTVKAGGEMQSASGKNLARFVTHLSFYAGSSFVEIRSTLHNPRAARHPGGLWDLGDQGSIYFKDVSLHAPLATHKLPSISWKTQPFQLFRKHVAADVEIYQDSSGGENWRSTNHGNRFGEVKQSFRGYRVSKGDSLLEEGCRATPIVAVVSERGVVAGTIEKLWQNFPKAIEAQGNELIVRLFPKQFSDLFELQGGEQKTHTVYLQFHGAGEDEPDLSWIHDRLVPRATPEWYAKTRACNYLSPRAQDHNAECLRLIDTAIDGPQSFFARREIIDEYGWRHFGDLYADHEAVGHTGETPLVAHFNNQYDVIYGAIVQYLRSGDRRWFELMADLARHVIDIDIYHTEEDRPAYNGGLFWHTDHYLDAGTATHRSYSKASLKCRDPRSYGGGPSNEHNYTSGLLHYYYLTGDETAREAVLSLADWVINMDDGSGRCLGLLDARPTGFSSASASRNYHGPGRGAGNSLNALVDAYFLTQQHRYLAKAEELIRRCIHPRDDFQAIDLENIEHHWSYLVFLQALGKYLDCKVEKSATDYMYHYARSSLAHYARWMLDHEVPYATVLHRVEIPSETWPAQDIRKSVIFHLAAKYADGTLRDVFRDKAGFFFEACIRDLRLFPTCRVTRPIALLMSCAHVHAYFQQNPYDSVPQPLALDFAEPSKFTPQFAELYCAREKLQAVSRRLKSWRQTLGSAVRKTQPSWGSPSG
jgi:hypothetical protein